MNEPAAIVMEQRDGGLFLVGEWPEYMAAADTLLAEAESEYVSQGDGMLRVTFANGSALYGRVGEQPHGISLFRLLSASSPTYQPNG